MRVAVESLDLVNWRRRVGDLYRLTGDSVLERFRSGKDELFRDHPQSPIEPAARAGFDGLRYYEPDANWRFEARFEAMDGGELVIPTGGDDGDIRYRRAGRLRFNHAGAELSLTVLSLVAYGGGLFCPFADATSGSETYGGGRYLFDTPKDTDGLCLAVTAGSDRVTIDFNYAYNPSCAYSPRWACPLAPPENRLPVPVRAGERIPFGHG